MIFRYFLRFVGQPGRAAEEIAADRRGGFPWPEWAENFRQFVFPLTWLILGSTLALSRIHKLAWWKCPAAVLVALIPLAGIPAVFIR